jgi:DNA-binding transcriptional LysR family regulator
MIKMSFDLNQLRAFEAVTRHGGFSRASEEVGLTQPTLSTHIKNLESSLGVRLFDRASRSVKLTPAGLLLAEYARKMLDLYAETIEAVEAFTGRMRGSIHVDASTVPGEYILPRWLVQFHRQYPEIQVTLTVSDSATVLARIENGETPIGITGNPGSHSVLESRLLCDDEIVLVALPGTLKESAGGGVDPADLPVTPLIRREPGSGTQLTLEKVLLEHGFVPADFNWAATLGSTRAVIEGVLAGLGGAFLSRNTVARELAGGTLEEIPVRGINIQRGLFVVCHSQRTLSPAASCFLEELLRTGPDIAAGIKMS